jgi:hypothetical protein
MLFDDIDDAPRNRAIKLLEDSLFGACTLGAHYFHDVPPTYPGFDLGIGGGEKPSFCYKVTINH